jgi:hypothetical protein
MKINWPGTIMDSLEKFPTSGGLTSLDDVSE